MTQSFRDKILELNRPVPRYTSYPAAPHFQALDDVSVYEGWLKALPEGADLSLYVHVPFCAKMCWYCGCNTKVTQRYEPVSEYVDIVLKEIDILAETLGDKRRVAHMHFGGGSPTMLSAGDFDRIMSKVHSLFLIDKDSQIDIEVDPREIDEEKIATYAKQGVNRVSLGVQDFDEKVLEAVNRQQPFALSDNTVKTMRKYGIDHINIDLLYGLPHQSVETIEHMMETAMLLKPDRIAFFGYAHVPWMKKHMRMIKEEHLPGKELRYDLFEAGIKALASHGYKAIGIDHFVKPDDNMAAAAKDGTLRRNFQGYTTDDCDILIGIGSSSIGKLPQGYIQNAVDKPNYKKSIEAGHLSAKKFSPLSDDDRVRGAVIERLMCDFSVNVARVCEAQGFAADYLHDELASLSFYEEQGFIHFDEDGTLHVHKDAKQVVRLIASAFDSYMQAAPGEKRHSQAV